MASPTQVKQYLAYWFQLGKGVAIKNGEKILRPQPVIRGDRYSREFEECWHEITSVDSGDCYLEGTQETIAELLTQIWEINDCSRCQMPIPIRSQGMPPLCCPCFDLPNWPDNEKPEPRSPIDSHAHLLRISQRLVETSEKEQAQTQESKFSCPLEPLLENEAAVNCLEGSDRNCSTSQPRLKIFENMRVQQSGKI